VSLLFIDTERLSRISAIGDSSLALDGINGKGNLLAGKMSANRGVGSSDDQLIPLENLNGEILVPYRSHSSISPNRRRSHAKEN
jgi:hypothetical protein